MEIPREIRPFFRDDSFVAEYDTIIEGCPDSVLAVPPIVSVAPIAWATKTDLSLPAVDSMFYESLRNVKAGYAELYPSVFDPGELRIVPDQVVETPTPDVSRPMVLFSGGVDSTAVAIDVLDREPALFTIHGSDLRLENERGWQNVREQVESFARSQDLPSHVTRSNFRKMVRYPFLDREFREDLGRRWWGAVQYGTAIPALSAPVAYEHGYSPVLQGSGYTEDPTYPTAQPVYVDELEWVGTTVRVADADVSRQEKIARIADAVRVGNELTVRSCFESESGHNCSECKKCWRTVVGLILEGMDPNEVGYRVTPATLAEIRHELTSGETTLSGLEPLFWGGLRERADPDREYPYDDVGFFEWLAKTDFEAYRTSAKSRSSLERIRDAIIRLPYPANVVVYDNLRPLGRRISR